MNAASPALNSTYSGVYRAPADFGRVQAAARAASFAVFTVDLAPAGEKVRFLAECARDLRCPESFGGNWDALADCLQDFSWRPAPGYLIRFVNAAVLAAASPADYATAIEILGDAAAYWRERQTPFIVLIDGGESLPPFPAA
jgi:hypothetical protein